VSHWCFNLQFLVNEVEHPFICVLTIWRLLWKSKSLAYFYCIYFLCDLWGFFFYFRYEPFIDFMCYECLHSVICFCILSILSIVEQMLLMCHSHLFSIHFCAKEVSCRKHLSLSAEYFLWPEEGLESFRELMSLATSQPILGRNWWIDTPFSWAHSLPPSKSPAGLSHSNIQG
jgi:hypothetical protein